MSRIGGAFFVAAAGSSKSTRKLLNPDRNR
jgi:hypothetical protein